MYGCSVDRGIHNHTQSPGRYNEKTDVYSFGVMLYEVFSRTMLVTTADAVNPGEDRGGGAAGGAHKGTSRARVERQHVDGFSIDQTSSAAFTAV